MENHYNSHIDLNNIISILKESAKYNEIQNNYSKTCRKLEELISPEEKEVFYKIEKIVEERENLIIEHMLKG